MPVLAVELSGISEGVVDCAWTQPWAKLAGSVHACLFRSFAACTGQVVTWLAVSMCVRVRTHAWSAVSECPSLGQGPDKSCTRATNVAVRPVNCVHEYVDSLHDGN